MNNTHTSDTTKHESSSATPTVAKSARITLTSRDSQQRLTLFAVRRDDDTANTFVVTSDVATKKTARGMTEKHATFADAQSAIAKHAQQAEKLGWLRNAAQHHFRSKPDAFSSLPLAQHAADAQVIGKSTTKNAKKASR
jgi:hypothetical protein